jgi:hypothetical protein
MEEKKLFKYYLDKNKEYHGSRPQFDYRINRWRFNTFVRRPMALVPWSIFSGWIMKGAYLYIAYYILFKSTPFVKHWNREGYEYEREHKAPPMAKWG